MSHTATARQCLLGTQSCHVCLQSGGMPGSPAPLSSHCRMHTTSCRLIIDDLPQPSSRSDNHESCFNLKLVRRHREPIPHMCRPCALQFGHVPPVWALSCVTLRVLCACRQPVWQAPNSRLTVTAPLTGWYWRDRIELPSGCGLLAVEEPVSFEIGSGEAARWQDGDCEDCDGGCLWPHVWQLWVAAWWGTSTSHVGWGCVLWRLGGGGCARVVLLGAWQGMGRPRRSSGSIASHVLCLCCHEHGPWSPTVACGTVNRDQVKSMFVS